MHGLVQPSAPAVEPLTLAEAKLHLRVATGQTDEDSLISALIVAARRWFERRTNRQLVTATWRLTLDAFPLGCRPLLLPVAPVASVTSVSYVGNAGATYTLAATKYVVSTDREPARLMPAYGLVWPVARWVPDAVQVVFVAGYGVAAAVPDDIKSALRLVIGHLYENREEVTTVNSAELPQGAKSIAEAYGFGDEFIQYGRDFDEVA